MSTFSLTSSPFARAWRVPALLAVPLLLGSCSVGPDYTGPPPTPTPVGYKETGPWKPAHPQDDMIRGKWWEMYHDPQLNALEEQVNINNQNVLLSEAQFLQAAAAVKVARAGYYPTLTTSPAFTESQAAGGGRSSGGGATVTTTGGGTTTASSSSSHASASSPITQFYDIPANASYLVDVWGSVRRTVESNSSAAQASFADLENARLLFQSTLAEDYFQLLGLDAEKELLETTLKSYDKYVTLTLNRYKSGIASQGDVAQAQALYDATKVQLVDLGVNRAVFEDAIATLIGRPAPDFSIKYKPLHATPPAVPAGVPSELLERRPDIAAAERRVSAANATIGVNVAAYYPQLTLSGSTGTQAIEFSQLFSGPAFFWSVGPTLAQTLFDGGRIHGQVQEAQGAYDASVATYRQTVLTAFQQVEDNLAGLRVLKEETSAEEAAVMSAQKSLEIATNQYQAGTQDYLFVITAQTTALTDEVNAVNLQTREMTTSVLLVQALGGGWDTRQLPDIHQVSDVPEAQQQIDKGKPAQQKNSFRPFTNDLRK